MTEARVLIAGLVAALALGAMSGTAATACPYGDRVLAADESQAPAATTEKTDKAHESDSAKLGQEEGTHTGGNQGAKPESDTDKIDQPERRNPTTGN